MARDPSSDQHQKRMPTGIAGLDEIINGGLPRGGVTVVVGGPGSGKTTFGLQVLATGAREMNEPGIMVAFEESGERILANASSFTWGGAALAKTAVHFMDAQLAQSVETGGEFDLVGFLAILRAKVEELGVRRIVFDGMGVLLGYLTEPMAVQRELFRLRDWVNQRGISAIVTSKSLRTASIGDSEFLQFIADCVVSMSHRVTQGTALRFLRVEKYRGAPHSANEIPLTITSAGLEVAANVSGRRVHVASSERISSGVERLDAMLEGGYHRGSSVLVTGAPGTAKTSLAASFAEAAALRGEPTIYVSFDEAADQIIRNVASIGIRLAPLVESGVLRIESLRARSQSPEAHVAWVRALLRESRPQNVVIDPLSALGQRGCEGEAEAAALQLLDIAKTEGFTLVSTSLMGNLQPLVEHTPYRISTIADTWMHVSYEARAGERNRALTVIKSRGTAHSNQVRELVLSSTGVTLANVYAIGGDVLMGTLRWEKENEVRRLRETARGVARLRERKAALALTSTKANLAALGRKLEIQESELEQLKLAGLEDIDDRTDEEDALRLRRRADPDDLLNPRSPLDKSDVGEAGAP